MSARTKARKRALNVLFEADQRGANLEQVLNQRLENSGTDHVLPEYSVEMVRGVISQWLEINTIIQDASPEWQMSRMPAVDRALLRLATWEILSNDQVATSVAIDEAVTIAAELSTDDSAKFVNGILSTIAREAPAIGASSEDTSQVE